MTRLIAQLAIALGIASSVIWLPSLTPAAHACEAGAALTAAAAECHIEGADAVSMSQSGDGHVYTLRVKCDAFSDDIDRCKHFTRCGPDTPPHVLYNLLRDGTVIGEVCLDPDQASQFGEITPGLVLREFKSLDWPSADLVIQPPDNETLVNFKTLFYTTLAKPATQTITLLGRKVVIEATPTTYIWRSDQGSETWETDDPSRPIERGDDPTELNHYVYEAKGNVRPSVDVVYTGRYQVEGGAWQEIPDTLTLTGEPVALSVLEATPVLTGEYN
jgi:hypothetical protein